VATQDLTQKKSAFLTRYFAAVGQALDALGNLDYLREEWDRLDYGNQIVQADIEGFHLHLTPQILADGFNSHAAINALLAAGHGTNLERVRG
jgi:hypothetical protein